MSLSPSALEVMMSTPAGVIVLGMHRSGTSLAGQVLDALGFHFGPESLALAPKKDNPLGYWERKDVIELNDRAFAADGVSWERIGTWNPEGLTEEFRREFDAEARKAIAAFPEGQPWFFKDPRLCVTLPLWQPHFGNPVYLFVYRHPAEIARSLWSRNQHPPKLVLALWERYIGDALNATRGRRRIIVRYPDMIADPVAAVHDLASQLRRVGVEPPIPPEEAIRKIVVDRSLRHHQNHARELEIPLSQSQSALNARLADGSALAGEEWVDVSAATRQIQLSREIVELAKTPEMPPAPAGNPLEAAGVSKETGEPADEDGAAEAMRFLEAARGTLARRAVEALEGLETVHHLRRHLQRNLPGCGIGNDYVAVTLANFCTALAGFPLGRKRREARQQAHKYLQNPPVRLSKRILQSRLKPALAWAEKLDEAGLAAQGLLGEMMLGQLPLLPKRLESESPLSLVAQYRQALRHCSERVASALRPLEAFAEYAESAAALPADTGFPHPLPEAEVERLKEWTSRLSRKNFFAPGCLKALREFRAFRAAYGKPGAFAPQDGVRFRLMLPGVVAARERLRRFLADLELAEATATRVADAIPAG